MVHRLQMHRETIVFGSWLLKLVVELIEVRFERFDRLNDHNIYQLKTINRQLPTVNYFTNFTVLLKPFSLVIFTK